MVAVLILSRVLSPFVVQAFFGILPLPNPYYNLNQIPYLYGGVPTLEASLKEQIEERTGGYSHEQVVAFLSGTGMYCTDLPKGVPDYEGGLSSCGYRQTVRPLLSRDLLVIVDWRRERGVKVDVGWTGP